MDRVDEARPRKAAAAAAQQQSRATEQQQQLPTPSVSPEPEDVASQRNNDDNHNGVEHNTKHSNPSTAGGDELSKDGGGSSTSNGGLKVSSTTAGSGVTTPTPATSNDEAVLSDASEKGTSTRMASMRPHPTIKRPGDGRRRSSVTEHEKMLKLSPKQIHELTSEPASIPVRAATPILEDASEGGGEESGKGLGVGLEPALELPEGGMGGGGDGSGDVNVDHVERRGHASSVSRLHGLKQEKEAVVAVKANGMETRSGRPTMSSRSMTTPSLVRRKTSTHRQAHEGDAEKRASRPVLPPLNLEHNNKDNVPGITNSNLRPSVNPEKERDPSPIPTGMPLPPFSIPTFLSLELSGNRPSPLYIYRPSSSDFPYESSKIKYERLVNFLFLPPKLEGILGFGALACLDAWMHVLTILPLRFLLAVWILSKWWGSVIIKEIRDLWNFVYSGLGRVWRRRNMSSESQTPTPNLATPADEVPPTRSRRPSVSATLSPTQATNAGSKENGMTPQSIAFPELREKRKRLSRYRHRRTKSTPSALLPSHKADILKGLLVITSCAVLMRFDASKMYHSIRGQAAIKLYVIYNTLEVCDRLLAAVGQDVLECLLSRETLDRNADGRSKVIRPFWMFVLALLYTVAHATALFYQVITLNVAVNSYSNALLTLLMSNQFVEIKGTVFKKFEKENLFQVTCADIVERFQLWMMLLIIAMRNIVEVGGLSIQTSSEPSFWRTAFGGSSRNATAPFTASSMIPRSFTIFPTWIGQVLNPFLLVLGSEMLVDWLKHAYITKFNQTKPEVYSKFLDVLAKDYYSNAFTDPNLTRRLGLPVLPLACLFIRAAIQTYHMFIATHMPLPFPSTATSLTSSSEPTTSSPATTAALAHIDQIFRRALGRSSFGAGVSTSQSAWTSWLTSWTLDDFIAFATMAMVFLVLYLVLLAFKILLGMFLLRVARDRYHTMHTREKLNVETGGKRIGGWGVVDVSEDQRRWIYNDDPEGLRAMRERDERQRKKDEKEREGGAGFGHVSRYAMVAKRIW